MQDSTAAFLTRLVDYAGMFPPARLPLAQALENFLRLRRSSPHAWMLGRFVCPVAQFGALTELAASRDDIAQLEIAVLGQQDLETNLEAIRTLRRAFGRTTVVEVLEWTLPEDIDPGTLPAVQQKLQDADLRGFLEIPGRPTWRKDVETISRALGNLPREDDVPRIGLKLRCGGTTAEAFPSDANIAHFIVCCRGARLPWKATAGLHHPRRHWDSALQIWHHGFLNVFGAGLVALSNPLSEAEIAAILADRDGEFIIDAAGFSWKDWRCPLADILEIRRRWLSSFGSCSFEEPCEDLQALGLV